MKRGISLVSLVVIITITLTLITTLTVSGINTANNAKKIAFAMEIQMVQDAVNSYYTKNDVYPSKNAMQISLSGLTANDKAQFSDETITSNQISVYEIDYSLVGLTDLKYGDLSNGTNDIYVISQKTGKVYYAKGLKIGNARYFTVTDELKNILNYNSGKNEQHVNDAVIFDTSTTEWTNSSITVKVKVPTTFTSVTVTPSSSSTSTETGYKVYNLTISQNTTINVKYKLKSSDSTYTEANYKVENIDTEIPVITATTAPVNVTNINSNIKWYIKDVVATDKISGVKKKRYCYGNIGASELKSTMESYGKDVEGDVVPVEAGQSVVTICAIDNAGNYSNPIHIELK